MPKLDEGGGEFRVARFRDEKYSHVSGVIYSSQKPLVSIPNYKKFSRVKIKKKRDTHKWISLKKIRTQESRKQKSQTFKVQITPAEQTPTQCHSDRGQGTHRWCRTATRRHRS